MRFRKYGDVLFGAAASLPPGRGSACGLFGAATGRERLFEYVSELLNWSTKHGAPARNEVAPAYQRSLLTPAPQSGENCAAECLGPSPATIS